MAANLIIKNVTVIDGSGAAPASGMDVVIRDGVFEPLRRAAHTQRDAAGATTIDGQGRFLVPGLWESHTHLRPILKDDEQASQAALDHTLSDYLASGITSVVDLGGPVDPYSTFRDRQRSSGPAGRAQLLFAGPSFTGINGWPMSLHHNPTCAYEIGDAPTAVARLRALMERQPDVIKVIYDGESGSPEKLPLQALQTIVAESHERGVRVVVHVRTERDSLDALEAGADGLEHSFLPTPGREEAEAERLTEVLRRTGAYLTPTLAAWEQIGRAGDDAYLAELVADGYMSQAESDAFRAREPRWGQNEFPHHPKVECLERLRAAFRVLPAMQAAGVKWAAGSDIATVLSRPGATFREITLLARAGIPAKDVLFAGTRHAAEKVGLGATVGTIEPGKSADALLLDANPLDGVDVLVRPGHLLATIKHGELYPISLQPSAGKPPERSTAVR
jgi:imidazolonepropionase-like amidohydrolase